MNPIKIVDFLENRIYLIDYANTSINTIFTIEEKFNNYTIHPNQNIMQHQFKGI